MQADKVRAIAVIAVAVAVIALGIALAIVSPKAPDGAATPTATPPLFVPDASPREPTPTPSSLTYAFEGMWVLDFPASGLVRPASEPGDAVVLSSLLLDRGTVVFETGSGNGCDLRSGTFESDGLALTIRLGPNSQGGCHDSTIDDVVARLSRVAAVALAPCPKGYVLPWGEAATPGGSCQQLSLQDQASTEILVYAFGR